MTDLHTHILPGIDDGSKNVEMSLELLNLEKENEIHAIACTPHFDFERQDLQEFIQNRFEAAKRLAQAFQKRKCEFHLKFGAEVRISPSILENETAPLCYQNTKIMLLEMPTRYRPQWDCDVIYQLTLAGVTPLIAHIERYPYLQENPSMVLDWFDAGAFFQVNATSIVDAPRLRKLIYQLADHNLVHVVASDTHSPDKRPPKLAKAMKMLSDKFGSNFVDTLKSNADSFFAGEVPEVYEPLPIKKGFWGIH